MITVAGAKCTSGISKQPSRGAMGWPCAATQVARLYRLHAERVGQADSARAIFARLLPKPQQEAGAVGVRAE